MCAGTDRIRKDDHTCRAQVNVIGIQSGTIKGSEPVDQRTRRTELQNGLGEIGRPVVGTVASCDIQIAARGGFSQFARLKNIYVLRVENGKQVKHPFNYKEVVKGKNPEQNILLEPSDVIVVP
jgi:hypothetical protein